MKKNKPLIKNKEEILLLFVYFLLITLFILYLKTNYLVTVFLYFAVPSIYISIKKKEIIRKTFIFSFVTSLPLAFVVDYIGHVSYLWCSSTMFSWRVLNAFPVETFLWALFYAYFIVSFYEYFFDKDKNKKKIAKSFKILLYVFSAVLFLFAMFYFFAQELLIIKEFYIFFVIFLMLIPFILVLYRYEKLRSKIWLITGYFFVISFIYELVAIYLGNWSFYSHQYYIGILNIFGFRFPVEEFLWLVFAAPALLCIYEYFADDKK